ncbi:MAG: YncE family protein, partial [Candidatus Diapherotrites archaeon]
MHRVSFFISGSVKSKINLLITTLCFFFTCSAVFATSWDITKYKYQTSFSIVGNFNEVDIPEYLLQSVFFSSDGTKMYILGDSSDRVYQYSLSTAWDISTASYDKNFYVGSRDTSPRGLFFSPDGTKMYILGDYRDRVYQYSLSTAWDISTASYDKNFYVGSQDTSPRGLFFSPDGTKMYILGDSSDRVYQYSLSTAWDISTASYDKNFYVGSQDTYPRGLFFSPDGTKMYILGDYSDRVYQYSLSTAWDISTASYDKNFYVGSQDTSPSGLFFSSDGNKMYISGAYGGFYQYVLSTEWNISTAVYQTLFSPSFPKYGDSNKTGLFFSPDGTKMYVLGNVRYAVYQYFLYVAWEITTAYFGVHFPAIIDNYLYDIYFNQ